VAVQVLVLDRLVEPLDDAVGLRRAVPGPDLQQLGRLAMKRAKPTERVPWVVVTGQARQVLAQSSTTRSWARSRR
jgi:hypothetical protein